MIPPEKLSPETLATTYRVLYYAREAVKEVAPDLRPDARPPEGQARTYAQAWGRYLALLAAIDHGAHPALAFQFMGLGYKVRYHARDQVKARCAYEKRFAATYASVKELLKNRLQENPIARAQ